MSAFRRIYFDLETEIAERLALAVKAAGKTQRAFIRDAIVAALPTEGKSSSGKGKK